MLLATDLDGTFLAGEKKDKKKLYEWLNKDCSIDLVFVTGRGLQHVLPLLKQNYLPKPDFLICDVGATITYNDGTIIEELTNEIENKWPGKELIFSELKNFHNLKLQGESHSRRCSFFCNEEDISEEITNLIQSIGCDYLFSGGKYFDVLPKGVNKGSSIKKLINFLGIESKFVLTAGDTLNDLSMFQNDFYGVCVGNSENKLIKETFNLKKVLHSNKIGCGGILDGISYFFKKEPF